MLGFEGENAREPHDNHDDENFEDLEHDFPQI